MGNIVETLVLKEEIIAEIYRGHRGFYTDTPDEILPVQDLIVTTGRVYLAKRISAGDTVASAMAHVAIGTGSTGAALGDTALGNEVIRKASAINSTLLNTNVWSIVATFGGFADSITSAQITEAGVFNHASSGQGTMFQRVTFSAVTLANSDLYRIELSTNCGSS